MRLWEISAARVRSSRVSAHVLPCPLTVAELDQLVQTVEAATLMPSSGALNNDDSTRYSTVMLEDVKKMPIFPLTSRANSPDFLLRSAVGGTFIRKIAVVLDAREDVFFAVPG